MLNLQTDLLRLIDDWYRYLRKHKFRFDDRGFPVFTKRMFLKEIPDRLVPFDARNNRKLVLDMRRTALCLFTKDRRIYPRLEKLLKEIYKYKPYAGIVASDVTVTSDMDQEWQDLIMLLNQLYMAILALNKIKIIANSRIGNEKSIENFRGIPKNVPWCASFFGGKPQKEEYNFEFLAQMMSVRPSIVLLFGKREPVVEEQLSRMGIPHKAYADYISLCSEVYRGIA